MILLLFALYTIYRGYDVFFHDAYVLGDELSDDCLSVLKRKHVGYGIMFVGIGLYLLYHLLKNFIDKK